jgi:hypothetical protein
MTGANGHEMASLAVARDAITLVTGAVLVPSCFLRVSCSVRYSVKRDGKCGAASMTSARQGTSPLSLSANLLPSRGPLL